MLTEKWNEWNSSGAPKYPNNKLIQFMLRSYPTEIRNTIKVLDLGCGSGANTVFLAEEGFKTYASDISSVGVEKTKLLIFNKNLRMEEIKLESISKISYSDNFFDCVISIGVYDSAGMIEARKSTKEISRVLKQGGKAFLLFAANDDFRIANNTLNIHGYSDTEVTEMFQTSAFAKVYVDHYRTTYANQTQLQHDYIITLFK